MRRALRMLPLFLAVGCADSPVEIRPQTQPLETARVLECGIGLHTSIDGGELQDGLGNCHWTGCGLEALANHHFGGCNDNLTAGAVRCR